MCAELGDEFLIADHGSTQVKGFARPVQVAALEGFIGDTIGSQSLSRSVPSSHEPD